MLMQKDNTDFKEVRLERDGYWGPKAVFFYQARLLNSECRFKIIKLFFMVNFKTY